MSGRLTSVVMIPADRIVHSARAAEPLEASERIGGSSVHWVLDVAFAQLYPCCVAWREHAQDGGVAAKRKRAGWDEDGTGSEMRALRYPALSTRISKTRDGFIDLCPLCYAPPDDPCDPLRRDDQGYGLARGRHSGTARGTGCVERSGRRRTLLVPRAYSGDAPLAHSRHSGDGKRGSSKEVAANESADRLEAAGQVQLRAGGFDDGIHRIINMYSFNALRVSLDVRQSANHEMGAQRCIQLKEPLAVDADGFSLFGNGIRPCLIHGLVYDGERIDRVPARQAQDAASPKAGFMSRSSGSNSSLTLFLVISVERLDSSARGVRWSASQYAMVSCFGRFKRGRKSVKSLPAIRCFETGIMPRSPLRPLPLMTFISTVST